VNLPTLDYVTEEAFCDRLRSLWAPPTEMTVSEWAAKYRVLSPETARTRKRYDPDLTPFQVGMMDAWTDPKVREITIEASAQVGKSTVEENCIGHTIELDPCGLLIICPTSRKAAEFSRERIDPMIRDNPGVRAKVAPKKSRDSNNTVSFKAFENGFLAFGSSGVSDDLASRPIPKVIIEEVDRCKLDAGGEGNPIAIVRKRLVTFWDGKLMKSSTPTNLATSLIHEEFKKGSQQHYFLPCPSCGEFHKITWDDIVWQNQESGEPDYETVAVKCPHCGDTYDSATRTDLLAAGKWIAASPEVEDHASFHIWAAYSPWVDLAEIVKEWWGAKDDPLELQVFYNTTLGLPWDGPGATVEWEDVFDAREVFPSELAEWVVALFVGVDTQDDRFEATTYGVGFDKEGYEQYMIVDHVVIAGDPAEQDTRNRLDDYILRRGWSNPSGEVFYPLAAAIDSAGHRTDDIYAYCRPRARVRTPHGIVKIIGIIGRDGESRPLLGRPPKLTARDRKDRKVYKPWIVGIDGAKSKIYLRLSKTEERGRIHIPKREPFDEEYCRGLTSQELIVTEKRKVKWDLRRGRKRDEPLDCLVYAMAARRHWGVDMRKHARLIAARRKAKARDDGDDQVQDTGTGKRPKRRKRSFIDSWRS
jgi:phage terminase large subunit GpA-like protein